jgi:hypothetical protein
LKTHLRGPGRVLRSQLPDLAYQEIWGWLLVHYTLAVLVAQAAEAADVDPDRVSFTRTVRLARRSATGTAGIPPEDWHAALPAVHAQLTDRLVPPRRHPHLPEGGQTRPPQRLPRQETRPARVHPPFRTRHRPALPDATLTGKIKIS